MSDARLTKEALASILFTLEYEMHGVRQAESVYARKASLWRDIFHAKMAEAFLGMEQGETRGVDYAPGTALGKRRENLLRTHRFDVLRPPRPLPKGYVPAFGRFYPTGLLSGVPGIWADDLTPFRCVGVEQDRFVADANHPLAGVPLRVRARVDEVNPAPRKQGGEAHDWLEELLALGGKAARHDNQPTDFWEPGAFDRQDVSPDTAFYTEPRLLRHIDDFAFERLCALHGELLADAGVGETGQTGKVLDLMSGFATPLDENKAKDLRITGLGLGRAEMEANPLLAERVEHDLNAVPELPFEDASFDVVLCAMSFEYLADPLAVLAEAARVLVPGGVIAVSFSHRWFEPKAIALWPRLHPDERSGFVLECLLRTGTFTDLATRHESGYPRPITDRYFPELRVADPLWLVSGRKAG